MIFVSLSLSQIAYRLSLVQHVWKVSDALIRAGGNKLGPRLVSSEVAACLVVDIRPEQDVGEDVIAVLNSSLFQRRLHTSQHARPTLVNQSVSHA